MIKNMKAQWNVSQKAKKDASIAKSKGVAEGYVTCTAREDCREYGEMKTKDIMEVIFDAGHLVAYGNISEAMYNTILNNYVDCVEKWAIKAWDSQGGTI